jgi:drug/metabolite transporter (DMT)-like permease
VDTLGPVAVSGIRFAIAAVFMLFWCRWEGAGLGLRKGQLGPCVVLGMLLFAQISLFTLGVRESNSSHGVLCINTFIFWVAVIEHFVTRAVRLPLSHWGGLLIAAAGVLLVLSVTSTAGSSAATSTNNDLPTLYGDAILLASGCLLGVKFVYTKAATQRVEPGKLIFWHDVIGVALFAAWSAAFEHTTAAQFTLPAVLSLLYQGLIVAGFCFAAQAHLLRRHSASQLSVFSFATPLFGIAISVIFRGDPLSPWLVVAGVLVAGGILIVTRPLPGQKVKD